MTHDAKLGTGAGRPGRTIRPMRGGLRRVAPMVAVLSAVLAGAPLAAQGTTPSGGAGGAVVLDARWRPFLGCWQSTDAAQRTLTLRGAETPTLCVVPAAEGHGVTLETRSAGTVVAREALEATGTDVPVVRDGCTGTERVAWATDGRRLLLRSAVTCDGVARRGSALHAITPDGEWLRVEGAVVNGASVVRAVRYRAVPEPAGADTAPAVEGARRWLSPRAVAGAPVTVAGVLEAARAVDAPVVEAWLTELQQPFTLDARALVELADAGVSPRVLDVLVAVSHPERFRVRAAGAAADERLVAGGGGMAMPLGGLGSGAFLSDPWLWDSWRFGMSPYGFLANGMVPWGFNRFGPYGPAGWGGGGWYLGQTPVVIAPATPSDRVPGRVVNGAGYTRGRGATGATPRGGLFDDPPRRSSGGSAGGASVGGSGGSPGGTSAGGGGGSTGRTAKPRGGGA